MKIYSLERKEAAIVKMTPRHNGSIEKAGEALKKAVTKIAT